MKKIGRFVLTPEFADAYELYFSGMFSPFFEILEDGGARAIGAAMPQVGRQA
jgi:hypothetical protein